MKKIVKDIVKLVAPLFIQDVLRNLLRVFFPRGSVGLKSVNFTKKHSRVIVLGNGPSLKDDLDDIKKMASQYDFICVNNFCSSPCYTQFKPNMYVFLDAYFFSHDAHFEWVNQREKTFSIINEKTTWPMKIFLPISADETILREFINNSNIEFVKMNVLGVNLTKCDRRAELLFNTGYFGPPQINVLIYAVYLAIWAKYQNVKIFGADLSFHKDVGVDQNDNDLFIKFRHFNNKDHSEKLRKNPQKIEKWSMGELMDLTSRTFYAHHVLNQYSLTKNISIYNCSSYSLIDSYKRN